MQKKTALVAGTFDPVTAGHLDLIKRAADIFDEVTVGIFENPAKKKFFTEETRLKALFAAVKDIPNVKIIHGTGFVGEFAKNNGITVIVKGARDGKDFEYEKLQAEYHKLHYGIETLILFSNEKYISLSSTVVRDKIIKKEDVSDILPNGVYDILKEEIEKHNKN